MSAIRDAFNNSNPANYPTVDPLTTAPLVDIKSMPGIGNYGAPPSSLDPSIDLNTLKPQFENIVIPPNSPLIPAPRSSVDPQQLLAEALQRRAQQGREAVDLRRQQLREQGALGYEDVNDPQMAGIELQDRMYLERGVAGDANPFGNRFDRHFLPKWETALNAKPDSNLSRDSSVEAMKSDLPGLQAKVLPGIGTAMRTNDGKSAVVGRYGVGYATQRDTPDPNREIDGIPAAKWFQDAARRQGESNQFNSKDGRKIVPDKVA